MSSKAIRDWFRSELVTRVPTVPYFDTVNTIPENKNLPDLWCTLEFNGATEQRISLGSRACFREFGEVQIIFVGRSGRKDDAVIDAAEQVRQQFFGINAHFSDGDLTLDAAGPPNTDATENGNWFLGSVSCAYVFDTIRGV